MPGVTGKVPTTRAPSPPIPPLSSVVPAPPTASIVIVVTPVGTQKYSTERVIWNRSEPDGAADAVPAANVAVAAMQAAVAPIAINRKAERPGGGISRTSSRRCCCVTLFFTIFPNQLQPESAQPISKLAY
ncbi:MAG: hypothetical protein C0482_08280 [Gordonia sp.]|nr:hypothetical protein [Gordonia sp. (in: high G+C Gram-positive bacteria)]